MVKVYSTSDCPWCKKTKAYLESKGIEYENVDVQKDLEGRKEFFSLSKDQSLPLVSINGNLVTGFDREKIDEYLTKS